MSAGERSGHLDEVLERLADYTEARQQLKQRMQLALFYPVILTVMSVLIVTGLLTYVVPEVVKVYTDMPGAKLPMLTRMLIGISDALSQYGLLMLVFIIAAFSGFRYFYKQSGFKHRVHDLLLKLPLIGRLTQGVNTARFARTLSILVASGVPVLEALRIAGSVMINLPMRNAVEDASLKVREGAGLARSLERSGYFPPMTVNLIGSGEASGKLEDMLERAATNQERELETTIAMVMGLFEPLMILVMGGVVLVIVLAILMPIFDLNQLIR